MAHDDPNDPSHRHGLHEHDDVIARPVRASQPAARSSVVNRPELAHGSGSGKVLHFDCFAGLAGDMIAGALLDLGVPRAAIDEALATLPLDGYEVDTEATEVSSIGATRFVVRVGKSQPYRTARDIERMLSAAALSDGVRRRALETFRVLAVAEAQVHRIDPADVHFHEVGAVDAIVDVVAVSAALDWLGARVTCTPLPIARGFTRSEHGILPLPAPAVVEILRGVPTEGVDLDAELVTPTGAALVKAQASEFVRWPRMAPERSGFGAGTRTLPDRPNLLRVVLGNAVPEEPRERDAMPFAIVETNVDDATGEELAHAVAALLREGALDAWTTAVTMKKGRPGWTLAALGHGSDADRLARVILCESPTLGVRIRPLRRIERARRAMTVDTEFGAVPMKVADGDGLPARVKPEDAVVQSLAQTHRVPAATVVAAAMAAFAAGRERKQS